MDHLITSVKYPFAIDRKLGALMEEKIFSRHVRQMMMQVLLTSPGERINRPDFGCGIRRMVFAPNNDATANLTQVMVMQALEKWLGELIIINEVTATAVNERLELKIVYQLRVNQQRQYLNFEVTL